ncbi:hypothetical protein Tco_0419030 [Tanacetum coccineum]
MACSLPHTDSKIKALVQRLINEDKGRQDVLLDLAFQFKDSCAVRDDLRKIYEKCCSSLQTDFPLTEKELHQLRMDKEALKEMLEEEAMNKKAQEEKIRQEQVENEAFFLEFGVVRAYRTTHHCGDWRGSLLEEVAFAGRSSSQAVTSFGLSYDVSDFGLPSEKVMASGKNGDDGDLLLFRDGLGAGDISAGTLRLVSQFFLEWNVPWRLLVPGSCQKHGLDECVSMSTPMATERLDANLQGTPTDQTSYHRMIGGLMYLTASRTDIAFATFVCARYQARPTVKHLKEPILDAHLQVAPHANTSCNPSLVKWNWDEVILIPSDDDEANVNEPIALPVEDVDVEVRFI